MQDRLDGRCNQVGGVDPIGGDIAEGLCEKLVMTAMRSIDGVGRMETDDRTDRAALLSDARMCGSVDEALAGQFQHGFLEGADQVKLRQHGPK